MWDASENADKELWSQYAWAVAGPAADGGPVTVSGTRSSRPADVYATDAQFEQQWSAAGDLSRYQVTTFRQTARGGRQFPKNVPEQQVGVDERRRLTLASTIGTSIADGAAPEQFVPGAVLPLVLRELADRPALFRTESFVGAETLAPPGLLTLFVTRLADAPVRLDDTGEPMECISVSVNVTGQVSRWYYSADQALRYIDFAGGLKAQVGAGK
jgi:hypothetical protein